MKLGDLVRFKIEKKGVVGFLGVVVKLNDSGAVVVAWSKPRPRPDGSCNPSCEARGCLEVISETR